MAILSICSAGKGDDLRSVSRNRKNISDMLYDSVRIYWKKFF